MDIKNALVRLRDDLKDWVTINLLTIKSLIPTKTSDLDNDNKFITEDEIETKLSGEITSHTHNDMYYTEIEVDTKLAKKADTNHGTHLTLGSTSSTAFRGDHGNVAYNHSQATHAPVNAQRNADITKAEIEAKLFGEIDSHTHNELYYTEMEVDTKLAAKADLEHGAHVSFDTSSTPKPLGTAANGTSTKVARADHVHPKQTTVANADKADELVNATEFTIGNKTKLFNGSGNDDMNFTLEDIGAAPVVHSHSDEYYSKTQINTELAKKANSNHGNHVPDAQTANNAVFLRNDNTWQTVTPANIGAAPASHIHDNIPTDEVVNSKIEEVNSTINTVQSTLQAAIDAKSNTGHTHDDRYYTESECNNNFIYWDRGSLDVNNQYDAELGMISSGTNVPCGSNYGVVLTLPYRKMRGNTTPDFGGQIFLPNGDDDTHPNSMFFRTALKETWNTWQEVATVAQTDALSETLNTTKSTLQREISTVEGKIPKISVLTQTEYDALATKDASTLYLIKE